MKIGIVTFHWPDNYGAVLQAYALQSYLTDLGHNVDVINYRPINHSLYYLQVLLHPVYLKNIGIIRRKKQKNNLLNVFRKKYIHLTKRYVSCDELMKASLDYDLLISGSDQVLNPSFTLFGERKPTATYYLPFCNCRKIGYAISFGCTEYPNEANQYSKKWIQNFDGCGVREDSGLNVLNQLGYEKHQMVVPDPTILYHNHLFDKIDVESFANNQICVYVLRQSIKIEYPNIYYMDDNHQPVSMESWLGRIINSCGLITNSYHGMIMAILHHVPFVALLETGNVAGMNDRFYTLLNRLGLKSRIMPNDADQALILKELEMPINWEIIDKQVDEYSKEGAKFLSNYLCE